jgi:hypothetical protein
MAATSVESFIESFLHPIIPPIEGLPTYESITDVTRLLNTNAASIHSELGDGQLGHLALTISPAVYATLSAIPFVAPPNPGPVPVLVPNVGTTAQIQGIIRDHKESLRLWREYNHVDAALKQQLIRAVDQLYICTLQHRHTGFANVTTRQLIQHLLNTYGNITPTELAQNDIKFRTAYEPAQPIEALFSQLEDAMDYADAGGNPYTAAQVVTNAYSIMFSTGLFPEACREWRRQPPAYTTWTNFKTDFAEAHLDLRLDPGTTQEGGYRRCLHKPRHGHSLRSPNACGSHGQQQRAHQTNRRQGRRNCFPSLCRTWLQPQRQSHQRALKHTSGSNRRRYNNTNYCWSHGYDIARNHTSQSCRYPGNGHQREATPDNLLNGSLTNKSKVM